MMEKTWRWFGKKDKITLPMLRQIGVEGIVTALHEVPNGEIWTVEAINDLKSYIESYGMRWSVVESLPVCEAIKYVRIYSTLGRTVPVRFTTTVFVLLTSTSKYWNVKELKKTIQKKNCIKLPNWTK